MATITSPVRRAVLPSPEVAARSSRLHKRLYVRTIMALDVAVIALAVIGGFLGRFWLDDARPADDLNYGIVCGALAAAWLVSLKVARSYDDRVLGYGADEYRQVVSATLRLAGAMAIIGYLLEWGISRGFLAITFATGVIGLPTTRYIARKVLHRARSDGRGWSRRVLVVGDPSHVIELIHQLRREPYAGYRVVGACIPDPLVAPVPQHLDDVPVVGSFRNILGAAAAVAADTVAVTGSAELTGRRLRRLGWQMEDTGIDLVLAPGLTDVAGPRIHTRPVAGLPLIHVESPEFAGGAKLFKAVVDRALAISALLLLSPVILLISAAIKLTSRGPVFYRQVRVGQGGREFDVYKFRSMVVDADAKLAQLTNHNETDGLMFKIRDDPRVTRVGRALRKWSMDELPQLFNVAFGHMSLVGPRPPLPSEVERYDEDVARRLLVKPGMTGLWQVSGRSDLSWDDGVRLDLYYVENWSLTTDVTILWKTVGAVLARRGAY